MKKGLNLNMSKNVVAPALFHVYKGFYPHTEVKLHGKFTPFIHGKKQTWRLIVRVHDWTY